MAETQKNTLPDDVAGDPADVAKQDEKTRLAARKRASSKGALEHSVGGATTKDDRTDMGVAMLPGDPSEPQGPEDAFGPGPKRGDYSDRIGGVNSFQVQPDGSVVDQNVRAEQQGEVKGEKGGVTTEAEDNDPAVIGAES